MSNLKKMIMEKGLKQKDVARMAGVRYKTLNRQCNAGIRTARIAKNYARVLGCNPAELLEF